MHNLDKILNCHPESINIVISAFQLYANKHDLNYQDMLTDVTNIPLDKLTKKHKKYKKSMTPYAKIQAPCSSYSYFMKDNYQKIKNGLDKPNPTLSEVSKEVSHVWANLDTKAKLKYVKLAENDKIRYQHEKANISDKLKTNQITKPKRPKSAFIFFLSDVRPKIKQTNPNIKTVDVAKEARQMWQTMSKQMKIKYRKMSELDKERYANDKKIYLEQMEKIL